MKFDLEDIRRRIDAVDGEIVGLVVRRMKLADEVAEAKRAGGIAVDDPSREAAILDGVSKRAGEGFAASVRRVYETLFAVSKERQRERLADAEPSAAKRPAVVGKLSLNREFALRYGAIALVFAGMGCWFGYDGAVRYPSTPAAALYESIEKSPPPKGIDLAAFQRQKIQSQFGLMGACFVASLAVGLVLLRAARLRVVYDGDGIVWNGRRIGWGDVLSTDRRQWDKKGIMRVRTSVGTLTLDAWHHRGAEELAALLASMEKADEIKA